VERFDAIVIGGGPAGAAAAILLAEAGWSVAVVEQKPFPRRKVCGEYVSATNWPLLARLGVADAFADLAGPPVQETAIFVGRKQLRAPLPRPVCGDLWGRALAREHLDTLLLERAAKLGACIYQPARCVEMAMIGGDHEVTIEQRQTAQVAAVSARVVIAAHGSWETGSLPTQRQMARPRGSDWLAFKAHFRGTGLPPGLMPLLSFADGYGGMVHCDSGRASLSCCIRRRRFERLSRSAGELAGEVVFAHILESCPVVRSILDGAGLDGLWLSAGVIRPGIRPRYKSGVFVIGNAAGEAHPVVAEGISMAMQSAWLLVERLAPHRGGVNQACTRDHVGRPYSAAWRRAFATRIRAATTIAHFAARPKLVQATGPLMAAFPGLITWGARLSGKSQIVVPSDLSARRTEWCEA
jgi:flavin-dependent dehydrogenase